MYTFTRGYCSSIPPRSVGESVTRVPILGSRFTRTWNNVGVVILPALQPGIHLKVKQSGCSIRSTIPYFTILMAGIQPSIIIKRHQTIWVAIALRTLEDDFPPKPPARRRVAHQTTKTAWNFLPRPETSSTTTSSKGVFFDQTAMVLFFVSNFHWLVVDLPLWKILVSWDDYSQ